MAECDKCCQEAEFLFEEQKLCFEHYVEAAERQEENNKINEREKELKERKL